ncbi:MAG: SufD family Fe-S cluster assembly protein, partial [Litorivicinus sp.]
ANARFENHVLDLGGKLHRDEIQVALNAEHAFTRLNGLSCVNGREVSDSHTRIEHRVPNTTSAQHYRGIADGRGKSVFNGVVVIEKDAQKSATEQKNANLLLSDKAEINPKPELQIHADDVTASHGSTVGNLDPAQLFYLRQRGIGLAEARALLTFAFAEQIAEALPSEALARAVEKRLATVLPAVEVIGDVIE